MKIDIRSYNAVHKAMLRKFSKTGKCEFCSKECRTHWSNKKHDYNSSHDNGYLKLKRNEWQELCPKCHRKYDAETLGVATKRTRLPMHTERELRAYNVEWGTLKEVEARVKSYAWYKP